MKDVILQAVLKHLLHLGNESVAVDEAELECHQQLQNLYSSTKAAKVHSSTNTLKKNNVCLLLSELNFKICYVAQHFQRNIVRGVEGSVSMSLKEMEIGVCLVLLC